MKTKVSIIDYGLCNLYNVSNALEYVGADISIIDKPEQINKASHIILPGVGAFKNGMRGLKLRGLIDPIKDHIEKKQPFLGICLGMQMMLSKSYEFGEIDGLDVIPGNVVKIPNENKKNISHKIPHIGWNSLSFNSDAQDSIFNKKINKASMYFVHSYKADCDNKENIVAVTNYNDIEINAIIKHDNAYGCQFHPEKSGKYGLMLLNDFLNA